MNNTEKFSLIQDWVNCEERVTVDLADEKNLSAMITNCTTDHVDLAIQTHFPHLKQQVSIPLGAVDLGEDRTKQTQDPDQPVRYGRLLLLINMKRPQWV